MSNTIYLSPVEKEKMAGWLAKRATAGGWVFIGLAVFALLMGVIGVLQNPRLSADDLGGVIAICLGMCAVGWWMLRYRRKVRRWLDEPLRAGTGRVLNAIPTPYMGKRVRLQIESPDGEHYKSGFFVLSTESWEKGDQIGLLFWENGRYCPRHVDYLVDIAYLPTPARRNLVRRRIITGVVVYLLLTALGFLLAIYGFDN